MEPIEEMLRLLVQEVMGLLLRDRAAIGLALPVVVAVVVGGEELRDAPAAAGLLLLLLEALLLCPPSIHKPFLYDRWTVAVMELV